MSNPELSCLTTDLQRLFNRLPVEDGYTHPAEDVVRKHISVHGEDGLHDFVRCSAFPASCVKILGRLTVVSQDFREELVTWGLIEKDCEIRDATIGAVENWGGEMLLSILRRHQDPDPFLHTYAESIVRDLKT